MENLKLLIDGRTVAGEGNIDVMNPATGQRLTSAPSASRAQLDSAVKAARVAFPDWRDSGIEARREALMAVATMLEANSDLLGGLLTQEQGKPLAEAKREANVAALFFRAVARMEMPVRRQDSAHRKVELRRRPLGVVGAIVPWNFPLVLMALKLPAALLAGNTVVLKPAPTTPLATLKLGELLAEVLPRGVLNVVSGSPELGAWMTEHPDIDKLSFTGSTETGKRVMAGAAGTLKRVTLELGGNDAAIVLEDADPRQIAPLVFASAFQNNGQTCIAIKRLYIHERVHDALCAELATLADKAVVGDGLDPATQFGPLQNEMHYRKVLDMLADGRRHGRILAGGTVPQRPGWFLRPTIVTDIADGTQLVDEEQFGPVLPVLRFSSVDDAVARANRSCYGLGASVWSADAERAHAVAERLEAGTVWINKHGDLAPDVPFGGAKQSGLGSELGQNALDEFTQLQVINAVA